MIHTPAELLPAVFAEFGGVLVPGGHLLVAFQAGDETVHLDEAYGHRVSLDAYRRPPEQVAEALAAAGFTVDARLVREPVPPEKVRQAYLLARKSPS